MKPGLGVRLLPMLALLAWIGLQCMDTARAVERVFPCAPATDQGFDFKLCWVGAGPRPYEIKGAPAGGGPRQRLGGLAWDIDVGDGAPHVGARSVPGFRHFEVYMESHPLMQGYCATDLGLIAPPGKELVRPAGINRSWTTFTLSYGATDKGTSAPAIDLPGTGGKEPPSYSVTVSRLTPAILVDCRESTLVLFGGPQRNWVQGKYTSESRVPKFVAVGDGRAVHAKPLGDLARLPLADLETGWLLFWWGPRAQTTESPDIVPSSLFYDSRWGKLVDRDVPVLAVFEKAPRRIAPGPEGGLLLEADGPLGKVVLLPLAGDKYPDTLGWKKGLPQCAADAANWWANRLRLYPQAVRETYAYDRTGDTLSVTDAYSYLAIGKGGIAFAPIPPMLALAQRYAFPVAIVVPDGGTQAPTTAPACTPAGYVTPAGPFAGVDAEVCTYRITGMGRYIDETAVVGGKAASSSNLEAELQREVEKLLALGQPLAPAVSLVSRRPSWHAHTAPWSNPGQTIYHLSLLAPLLPEAMRTRLWEFVRAYDAKFPADQPALQPYQAGLQRTTGKPADPQHEKELQKEFTEVDRCRFFSTSKMTPPENLYAIAGLLEAGGSWDLASRWASVQAIVRPFVAQNDWATLGSYRWKNHLYRDLRNWGVRATAWGERGRGGVIDVNCWFAGAIGFTRLARRAHDVEAEDLGRLLFAKAAALRFAMGKFARFYHDTQIIRLPDDPDCYRKVIATHRETAGYPRVLHWQGPEDDLRQVVTLDEFGATLRTTENVFMNELLSPFQHMVPELGRFLRDYLAAESRQYLKHTESHIPDWEVAFGDSVLGSESSFILPENSYAIFLAKAWILDEKSESLQARLDIPWVPLGDYYYATKLAATIWQSRGLRWNKPR